MPHSRADTMRVEERRAKVSALALQGLRPHEISARLGDTSNTGQTKVRQDLQAIHRQWKDSTVRDFDGAKTRILLEIALLKREAWSAYERSKRDRVTVRDKELLTKAGRKRRRTEAANGNGEAAPVDDPSVGNGLVVTGVEHETKTEPSTGDPRYLKIVADLVAEEAALLGLAPRPGEMTTSPPVLRMVIRRPDGTEVDATAVGAAPSLPGAGGHDLPRSTPDVVRELPPGEDPNDWEEIPDDDIKDTDGGVP